VSDSYKLFDADFSTDFSLRQKLSDMNGMDSSCTGIVLNFVLKNACVGK